MNKLPIAKKNYILKMLVDGMSLSETSRMADVSINTVSRLLVDAGKACQNFHNEKVSGLNSSRIFASENWLLLYPNKRDNLKVTGTGDVWAWTAIDPDTKIIVSWFLGNRDAQSAYTLICEVESRLSNKMQLIMDDHKTYLNAVPNALDSKIDYEVLVKIYGEATNTNDTKSEYSYGNNTSVEKKNVLSTNHLAKKMERLLYALALHVAYYNFTKIHKTLMATPAMAAGLTNKVMTIEEIVG